MRIDKLELVNFRGFERRSFAFNERVNVLIGKNGTGKTAVLDALVAAVLGFVRGFDAEARHYSVHNPVRLAPLWKGRVFTLEPQNPSGLTSSGMLGTEAWSSRRLTALNGAYSHVEEDVGLELHAQRLADAVSKGEDVTLPLVAYFGTHRLWRPSMDEPVDLLGPGSRLRGYSGCFRLGSSFQQLKAWFKQMELIQLQEGDASVLDAAKAAIVQCLEGWDEVFYHMRLDDLVARTSDGSRALPFHMLSDGVRNMIGMVGEIAYRAALLNPHLGADAAKKTPGVVLIDEVDLHLHPSWQRRVIDDLRRTFPEIQFFATTHSPIIVQSLRAGELIDLDGDPGEYEQRSVEDILEATMKVPDVQRSKRWHDMREAAAEYYRALREVNGMSPEEKERLKAKLDDLVRPFSDNPAYVALLDLKREAAGLGAKEP